MGSHPSQKRYPPELKERAVRMARDAIAEQGGQTFGVVPRIARQLGVGVESLRGWLQQADVDAGRRPGMSRVNAQRIGELEGEVRELRRANDILKAGGCRTNGAWSGRRCRRVQAVATVVAGTPVRLWPGWCARA